MGNFSRYIFVLLVLAASNGSFCQGGDFEPYNKRLLSPRISYWHEILGTANVGIALDHEESSGGNIQNGINSGLGAGYLFKVGMTDLDVDIGIGASYEIYPGRFHKFNALIETNVLRYMVKDFRFVLFNGGDFTITQAIPFDFKEAHTTLYFGAVYYKGFELKYGLQSGLDWFEESIGYYYDDIFHLLKFSYRLKL